MAPEPPDEPGINENESGERFANAVAVGFAPFFKKYGLMERIGDRDDWKEREIYANNDFLVSIAIN